MQIGDWKALFEHKSSNDSWNLFKEIMLKHEEACTNVSIIKRPCTLPYLTRSIKREMNRKNRYWAKCRQINSREQYDKFKKARSRLRKITRNSKKKHEDIIATETKTNPKNFWNYVSSAKPRRHAIPYLTTPSDKITDHTGIADNLNKQYSSVYIVENSRNIQDIWECPVNVTVPMVAIFESDVQE